MLGQPLQLLQFALDGLQMLLLPLADIAATGVCQAQQMQAAALQGRQVARGIVVLAAAGIALQLFEVAGQFAFSLHEQPLRVAGELAGGQ